MSAPHTPFEPEFESAVAAAAQAWPTLRLPRDGFARHLQERLAQNLIAAVDLNTMHLADLYLAYGCIQRDAAALTELHRSCWGPVQRALARFAPSQGITSDIWHELLLRLVYPEEGKTARLVGYAGRGPLSAWVAVSARRLASNLLSRRNKETFLEEATCARGEIQNQQGTGEHPLKAQYRERAQSLLRDALAQLSPRDRQLLRLQLAGLSFSEIGRLHAVDKSTVCHWFKRIRENLRVTAKAGFGSKVRDSELASIMRMVQSQIDLGLGSVSDEP